MSHQPSPTDEPPRPQKPPDIEPSAEPVSDLPFEDSPDDFFLDVPHLSPADIPEDEPALVSPQSGALRTRLLILAVVLLAALLTALVMFGAASDAQPSSPNENIPSNTDPSSPSTGEQSNPPEGSMPPSGSTDSDLPSQPSQRYEYSCDISAYLPAIDYVQEKSEILLLNKNHTKSATYVPDQLVELDTTETFYGKEIQLDATTAAALRAMLLCMRADGITDTFVTSGYRSYKYQSSLFSMYVREEMNNDPSLTQEEATALAATYSARAGQSEHQSGLCVDLITTSMGALDVSFENTRAFAWLQENAAQFGFILRYPQDKEHITGYIYEPWHYRFVGKVAALEITENHLTLEEYLGES